MTGNDYLADTNAIIYLVNGNSCMEPYKDATFSISIISEMELLSSSSVSDEEAEQIKNVVQDSFVINIDSFIKDKTIELRRTYTIKLPDAIIAATAICRNLTLITADTGFSKIEELNLQLIEPVFVT